MLHYHRCDDCLTAFTTTHDHVDFCDCSGKISYMGIVKGSKFVRLEDRSPCDGRCTHASGPVCDCICQGANHGTGKLVTVQIDGGVVRAIAFSEECLDRAEKYRIIKDYAEKLHNSKYTEVKANVTHYDWVLMRRTRKELDKIINMKQYDLRTNALLAFIARNK